MRLKNQLLYNLSWFYNFWYALSIYHVISFTAQDCAEGNNLLKLRCQILLTKHCQDRTLFTISIFFPQKIFAPKRRETIIFLLIN